MRRKGLNLTEAQGASGWMPAAPSRLSPPIFSELQCGVWLHTRVPEIVPILLDFIADGDDVRAGLARFAERHITAASVAVERLPEISMTLLLSAGGYQALGLSLQPFADEPLGVPTLAGWGAGPMPEPFAPSPHGVLLLSAAAGVDLEGLVGPLEHEMAGLVRACPLRPRRVVVRDETEPDLEVEYRSVMMNVVIPRRRGRFKLKGSGDPDLDELCAGSLIPDPYAEGPHARGSYFVLRCLPDDLADQGTGAPLRISPGLTFFAPSMSFLRNLSMG
jgi:hypothetical protein